MSGRVDRIGARDESSGPREGTDLSHGDREKLTDAVIQADLAVLSALANETRYETLRALIHAEDGLYVRELEDRLGVSQSAISHGLADLYEVGLVSRVKDGRRRIYRPTERAVTIVAALDAVR